jgi:hypothetical protein
VVQADVERVPTIIVGPTEVARISTSILPQPGVPLSPAQLVVTDAVDEPVPIPQAIQEHVRIGGGKKPQTTERKAAKGKNTPSPKSPRTGGVYYDRYGRLVADPPLSPGGALGGAVVGGLLGGPVGAVIGAGVGSVTPGVARAIDQPYYYPPGQPYYYPEGQTYYSTVSPGYVETTTVTV